MKESNDEVLAVFLKVLNERTDPVRINRFQGVQEHVRNLFVHIVGQISGKSENEACYFPFTLTEMSNDFLIRGPSRCLADNMEIENALRDFPPVLPYLGVFAFESNPFEVIIF